MDPSQEVVRFDDWTLLRPVGELVRGDTRVRLQSQSLHVLEELLARPGNLVTREQLIARLWPDGVVVDFDTALNSAVRRLRTTLGDQAEHPKYIETIPRRGYRFIGRVDDPAVAVPAGTVASAPATSERQAEIRAHRMRWQRSSTIVVPFLLVILAGVALLWIRTGHSPHPRSEPGAPAKAQAQARERVQRAEFFFQRRAAGDIDRARQYFTEAATLDPGFARAWSGLAGVYWIETTAGRLPAELGLSKVRDAAERALALDPRLAEPHLRLASYRSSIGDLRRRDEHLRQAVALEPFNPLVLGFAAGSAAQAGRFDDAIELQRRAVAASPLSSLHRYNLGWMLYLAGRLDEAKVEMLEWQELNPAPDSVNDVLAILVILEGQLVEALALVDPWPHGAERLQCLALAYHGLGRKAEAAAALRELIQTAQGKERIRIAEVHAYFGDNTLAFEWLQLTARDTRDEPWLQPALWMVPRLPLLRPLHADPRWGSSIETARQARVGHASE